MFKILRYGFLLIVLISVFSCVLLSVSADAQSAEDAGDMGYVEYKTEASINFKEVIEVTLTNNETGEEISHRLLRTNDYNGNFSVPYGTYTVSAEALSSAEGPTGCKIICSVSEIEVKESKLAGLVSLRVEEFTSLDVSDPGPSLEEMETMGTEPFITNGEEMGKNDGAGENAGSATSGLTTGANGANRTEHSPLIGIIVSVSFVGVAAAVLYFIKKRNE